MLQALLRDEVIKKCRALPAPAPDEDDVEPVAASGGGLGVDSAPRRAGLLIPGTEAAKKARMVALTGRDASVVSDAGADKDKAAAVREEDEFFKGVTLGLDRGESVDSSLLVMRVLTLSTDDQLDEDENVHNFEVNANDIEVRVEILDMTPYRVQADLPPCLPAARP